MLTMIVFLHTRCFLYMHLCHYPGLDGSEAVSGQRVWFAGNQRHKEAVFGGFWSCLCRAIFQFDMEQFSRPVFFKRNVCVL